MNGLKPIKIPSAKEKVASELRAILESACAGLAAEEGVDISGIRDSYEESKAALEKGDYSQYASQNREFHSEIWAAAGNKKMENMIAELWNGLSMGNMVTEQDIGIAAKSRYSRSRLLMPLVFAAAMGGNLQTGRIYQIIQTSK